MALVQHEGYAGGGIQSAAADHLVHDAEQLERIRGADNQVIIGIEAGVEVERTELAQPQQLRHDELDVGARRVVPGVQADQGLFAERSAVHVGGSPVRNVRVVESRLEELVLQHHPLVVPEPVVDLAQRLGQPVLPGPQVALAGVVGAVRQPDLQVPRPGLVHDLEALVHVVDGLGPHRRIAVGKAAELVVVILERVAVDRSQLHSETGGVAGQGSVVVRLVPGDVQGHGGRQTGEGVDLGSVGNFFLDAAGGAGGREDLEAGTGVAEGPGRQFDALLFERGQNVGGNRHVSLLWIWSG